MKIVSFPHYTCGGLLCDILNGTYSLIAPNGGISSINHSLGKIGDANDILMDFDPTTFFNALVHVDKNKWIGTHCWLGSIDLGDNISQVINVTTETYRSRLYRWIRVYHLHYIKSKPWQNLSGMSEIDKQRETAKNYLKPFGKISHPKVVNIEFSDVVEQSASLKILIGHDSEKHLSRWREINHWLYDVDLWTSSAASRFHEAEYEQNLGQFYQYE